MIENNRNNKQIYGRNDMIMLDPNNKIYGSLGIADKYVMKTEEGTMLVLKNPKSGKFGDVLTEFNMYGKSEQKQYSGKNLLKIRDGVQTERGVTVTVNDGVVALKGTATETGWSTFKIDSFTLNGTYILSSNLTDATIRLANKSYKAVISQNESKTLENEEVSVLCFVVKEGKTYDISNILVQIEKGTEATPYEPYVGGQPSPSPDYPQEIKSVVNPIVKVCGKNLLRYPYVEADKTSLGITFTDNKDGSINVSGTATGTAYYNLYSNRDGKRLTLASGTYKLVVKGRSKCNVVANNGVNSVTNEGTLTITDAHNEIYCYIAIQEGLTVDETIYPMIQLASITDESYEPYQEEQTVALPYTLNAIPVSSGGNYTDQSGQQYIADRVVEKDGVFGIERNIATDVPVLTKKLKETSDMKGRFIQDGAFKKTFTSLYEMLVNIGYGKKWGAAGNVIDKWIFGVNNKSLYISPPKNLNYTSEDILNVLKDLNIKVYGVLLVPFFEPLHVDIQAKLRILVTYYPVTIIENNYNTWMKATYKSTESV